MGLATLFQFGRDTAPRAHDADACDVATLGHNSTDHVEHPW
jgi:hypothetical protein